MRQTQDNNKNLEYTKIEDIIKKQQDRHTDSLEDTTIDIDIVDDIEDTDDLDTVENQTTLYSLDTIASLLKCSTKTITRYYSKICECYYWEFKHFRKGDKYTQLAFDRMENLRDNINPKDINGKTNLDRINYEDYKKRIWLTHQNEESENPMENSSQLAVVNHVESTEATQVLASIYNAQNEASKLSLTLSNFKEQFEIAGENMGHELAASFAGPLMKTFNGDLAEVLQKLGGIK